MVDGRAAAAWAHTSSILAQQFNINRQRGTAPKAPADFDPTIQRSSSPAAEPVPKVSIKSLKGLLMGLAPARPKPKTGKEE